MGLFVSRRVISQVLITSLLAGENETERMMMIKVMKMMGEVQPDQKYLNM